MGIGCEEGERRIENRIYVPPYVEEAKNKEGKQREKTIKIRVVRRQKRGGEKLQIRHPKAEGGKSLKREEAYKSDAKKKFSFTRNEGMVESCNT